MNPVTASRAAATPHARLACVSRRYGRVRALDRVDLAVHAGEVLAVLGPNGAGKSTVIALLTGLRRPDEGRVELFGRDPGDAAARRSIGVMLQSAALPDTLRIDELIRLHSSYYPAPRPLADRIVVLAGGRVLAEDTPGGIKARVAGKRVRCLTSLSVAVLAGWEEAGQVARAGEVSEIRGDRAERLARQQGWL